MTDDHALNESAAGALDDAYRRLFGTGAEFGGDANGNNGLANHGPMAAEALVRRGDAERTTRWLDHYVLRLETMPAPSEPIDGDNWETALGKGRARLGDWSRFFTVQMAERPWLEVLWEWWPRLLPGIAAGATHGVIRVGHALRSVDAQVGPAAVHELALALAFWAARSTSVPGAAAPNGAASPADAFDRLPRLTDQSGVIAQRLARLVDLPGWPDAQASLIAPAGPDDVLPALSSIVRAATTRYLWRGHTSPILLIHTATAPNAVRHSLPYLPREWWEPSLAAVWSAAAAITSAYEPPVRPDGSEPDVSRSDATAEDLWDQAVRHGDEHVIKFTDTAIEVFEDTGDPDALAAAARSRTLIDRDS